MLLNQRLPILPLKEKSIKKIKVQSGESIPL